MLSAKKEKWAKLSWRCLASRATASAWKPFNVNITQIQLIAIFDLSHLLLQLLLDVREAKRLLLPTSTFSFFFFFFFFFCYALFLPLALTCVYVFNLALISFGLRLDLFSWC